jgi:hypothetical protein
MERPRVVGAKYTNVNTAPDEKVESFDLTMMGSMIAGMVMIRQPTLVLLLTMKLEKKLGKST